MESEAVFHGSPENDVNEVPEKGCVRDVVEFVIFVKPRTAMTYQDTVTRFIADVQILPMTAFLTSGIRGGGHRESGDRLAIV